MSGERVWATILTEEEAMKTGTNTVTHLDTGEQLLHYPFPLGTGAVGVLTLPARLTRGDAERLAAYIMALAEEER